MRFQTKLQIFFVALFIAVQAITITAVHRTATNQFKQQSHQDLQVARVRFQESLKLQHDELTDKASTLLRNRGFTRAIISGNQSIIKRALKKLENEIQSDRLLVIGSNKRTSFDSNGTLKKGQRFFDPELLKQANKSGFSSGFILEEKNIQQVSFVPVQLTDLVIWIGLARQITIESLENIQRKIALPVHLTLLSQTENQPSKIYLSTDKNYPLDLIENQFNDDDIVVITDKILELPDNIAIFSTIHFSIDEALAVYQPMFRFLLLIAVLGIVIASVGSFFVARTITTPIRLLDEALTRIADGNYQQAVDLQERNEIGRLGRALNQMMSGLQTRSIETEYRLTHDQATGLPNRDFLEKKLNGWMDSKQKLSVVLVDIARFSEINNLLGHEKGDRLVVQFSKRLKSLIKSTDFIARLTGKSFVMVLLNAEIAHIKKLVERVSLGMDQPFVIDEEIVDTEVYMGVAHFPAHGNESRTLLSKAETALDEARHNPERYAVYDKRSDPYKPESLSLMGELRRGLKKDELFFEYQAKLDLASGLIVGAEALVRWNHPKRGKLFPDEFIDLAERSGNIGELTLWGLAEAMRQVDAWQEKNIDAIIAVNLSVKDIQYRQFTQRVQELLDTHKVNPAHIQLEITETEMMAKPELSLKILEKLHAMGFKLVIDDYGVGYSSMAYIKKLPVSEIKIDRSFITDILSTPEDNVIVQSTIDMVHSLGLKITAEGAEDELTLKHLDNVGCDYIQGYYVSKPLEKTAFEAFFCHYNSSASIQKNNPNSENYA